ncbi:hypothetical protein PR202_ga12188 [Eleusine coracana subsp. coracana]|uniref:Reverse transcriptase zinc-binding domain-containing protein n=1 Tax=Eleusine coracana subsp. coracana TaxID=191504 RepID=A0AAV5CBJ9_ELECO|nr:hypothetical protein PR202_ga12188 [Eleusine coracana subsp. coracana]
MFDTSIEVVLGDGAETYFWTDRWLNGTSIKLLAPALVQAVSGRTQRSHTVQQALANKQWIRDITGPLAVTVIYQYIQVWILLRQINISPGVGDPINWRWMTSKQYSAKSAYNMFFCGSTKMPGAKLLWKSWEPPKVKLFLFLAINKRTWTAERRKRHGL